MHQVVFTAGWRNDLAWTPDATILGYSTTSRRFLAFTARRRLAAGRPSGAIAAT